MRTQGWQDERQGRQSKETIQKRKAIRRGCEGWYCSGEEMIRKLASRSRFLLTFGVCRCDVDRANSLPSRCVTPASPVQKGPTQTVRYEDAESLQKVKSTH